MEKKRKKQQQKNNICIIFLNSLKEIVVGEIIKETKNTIEIFHPALIVVSPDNTKLDNNDNSSSSSLILLPLTVYSANSNILFFKNKISAIAAADNYLVNAWYHMFKEIKEYFLKKDKKDNEDCSSCNLYSINNSNINKIIN